METTHKRIADVLDGFDSEQLKKVYALLFDVWCWDSGNEQIKEIVDALQQKIEAPDGVIQFSPNKSSITHASNGISNEIFKFEHGSMSLGSDLEYILTTFIEERMFSIFGGMYGTPLENHLQNYVDNRIAMHHKILSLDSEISGLRSELSLLRSELCALQRKVDTR